MFMSYHITIDQPQKDLAKDKEIIKRYKFLSNIYVELTNNCKSDCSGNKRK